TRYTALVERVRKAETDAVGSDELAKAVARYFAKLMAYKDEYEVARLQSNGEFAKKVSEMFEGDYKLVFHLAPPMLAKADPQTGEPVKMRFGSWMMPAFRILATLKGLRGTAFDLFGHTEERRMERQLVEDYERTVGDLISGLSRENHAIAVEIASLPESIRGYGHIKAKAMLDARSKLDTLLARFRAPGRPETRDRPRFRAPRRCKQDFGNGGLSPVSCCLPRWRRGSRWRTRRSCSMARHCTIRSVPSRPTPKRSTRRRSPSRPVRSTPQNCSACT
ncbi:MAG: DUF6537 domain-containing protein, partial [Burkholderiales bacterium]